MQLQIEITEHPNGDVAVHIHQPATHASLREGRYADALTASIKAHLAKDMPNIVKAVLKREEN